MFWPRPESFNFAPSQLRELREYFEKRRAAREDVVETVSGVTGHPINFPFYITLKGRDWQTWFKVVGTLKGGSYKGFQSTKDEGDRKPSKAVQKTVPSGHQEHWKHVPAHEMPDDVMKRFATTSDGDKKLGGDPGAKVAVKAEPKADKKENKRLSNDEHDYDEAVITKIRSQIASIIELWPTSSTETFGKLVGELRATFGAVSDIEKAIMKKMRKIGDADVDLPGVVKLVANKWDPKDVSTVLSRMVRLGKVRQDGEYYRL